MLQNPRDIAGEATPSMFCGNHPRGGQVGPLEGKQAPSRSVRAAQGPRPVGTAPTAAGLGVHEPPRKVNIKILSHAPQGGECDGSRLKGWAEVAVEKKSRAPP